ncbi:MAG: hypothetical protein RIS31_257, partial [Actinomycetota bacterium]
GANTLDLRLNVCHVSLSEKVLLGFASDGDTHP